jgi:hypothetical protein
MQEINPHIVAITEIIPKRLQNIEVAEFSISGYTMFMNNAPSRGVAIYVKNEVNAVECEDLNKHAFKEAVWCTFKAGIESVLLGCIYKSPSSTDDNIELLNNLLREATSRNFDKVCIFGDFNYPSVCWDGAWSSTKDNQFVESIRDAFLHQMVRQPTRRREGQRSTLDDLVLVNDETLVSDIIKYCPLGKSDHDVLLFKLYVEVKEAETDSADRYDLQKGDYVAMRKEFARLDWTSLQDLDVEGCWVNIKNSIEQAMSKHIPKVKGMSGKKRKPAWLNGKVRKSIKNKYKLFKKYLRSDLSYDYRRYIESRNECNRAVKQAKREYERNLAKGCKVNAKLFWKYVQSKTKSVSGISPLRKGDGSTAETDEGKAEALNSFFSSVFTKEDTGNVPVLEAGCRSEGIMLTDVQVTPSAVKEKLSKLNPSKAQGPDKIPPKVLKELSEQLALPLTILFNKSIDAGKIPAEWKEAEVVAIFKKGTRSDPGNYRPVSLTCILCKVLESFIRDAIVRHMDDYNLYTKCQHGFRNKRSCVTQLLEVMEILTDSFDDGEAIDMVYLDFKKAFDTVPHQRLLCKLQSYGITNKVYSWVADFLSGRSQRVRVGKAFSSFNDVLSGIPQGSILGPTLFTIFINDISDDIQSFCRIFADDTKVFNTVKNNSILQEDLDRLQGWSEKWNLYFNASKCNVLHMGRKNPSCKYVLETNGSKVEINKCNQEKDLGVIFDSKLTFDAHIQSCISKANRMLGIIKRTFTYLDKESFLYLYKALVRPHLEYANAIWAPKFKRQSAAIERVQRRATKLLVDIKEWTYERRMRFLNLPSLKYRRFRGDLIQTFKILNKIDDIETNDFYCAKNVCFTRNSGQKLFISHCSTNTKLHSFSFRTARSWNKLSSITRYATEINAFKNLLDIDGKKDVSKFEYDN